MYSHFLKKAQELDQQDPLSTFKERFELPYGKIYLCSNSLGLPPKSSFQAMESQMKKWANFGAEAWFQRNDNWYQGLGDSISSQLASLLGALPNEILAMNSLTVNLHLLLFSFYQPSKSKFKIITDTPAFPSDLYAIKSHVKRHNMTDEKALILLKPRSGEDLLRIEDIMQSIHLNGSETSIVFLNNVNFLTGQAFNLSSVISLAHEKGCLVGLDMAHAAGNIPLSLHDSDIDFAVGCSYKYLCSGPGGPGIAFVHSKHHIKNFPRLSGWWGNDPKTRFQMQLIEDFIPFGGVNSWQVSTPSILSMIPLNESLKIFNEAGMKNIRIKSEKQTAFLIEMLSALNDFNIRMITPKDKDSRGCQLSIEIENAEKIQKELCQKNIICDFRPPNILRAAPSPLYNTFEDVYMFGKSLAELIN